MSNPYLVVLDTTDLPTRNGIPPNIINVHIINATDPANAKLLYLSNYPSKARQHLKEAVYVYDITKIINNLNKLEESKVMPMFSHITLAGQRPARQTDVSVPTTDDSKEAPQAHPFSSGRSREFQRTDSPIHPAVKPLTREQADLIKRSVGAIPVNADNDEGHNPRINSATGRNNSLTRPRVNSAPQVPLSGEKAKILAQLDVNITPPGIIDDPELEEEIAEVRGGGPVEDKSLAAVTAEKPISTEEIEKLQKELEQTTTDKEK